MTDAPLVSIGMPAYNGEKYIRRSIESLLAQDYDNFELNISDNASDDRTLRICEEYASRDSRIRIHQQPSNMGIKANFEKVLEMSTGQFFLWAAVDDCWLPGFISSLVKELIRDPGIGVAMCAVDCVFENNSFPPVKIRFHGPDNPNKLSYLGVAIKLTTPLKYNLFIHGIFRSSLLRKAFPLLPNIHSADRWFLIQIALTARFRYLDRVLHIRTLQSEPYYNRYPDEEYGKKIQSFDQIWFDFASIPVVFNIILQSPEIPRRRKFLAPLVIISLFYHRLILGVRRMARSFIVHFLPHSLQKKFLRSID
jgi:glycosyltransferase involved in cell wall biosynthesis